eukprot:m51a1_g7573 hypothetical protein (193) ;mRNA; f:175459-176375
MDDHKPVVTDLDNSSYLNNTIPRPQLSERLTKELSDLRGYVSELKSVLSCVQQDLQALRQHGVVSAHPAPVPLAAAAAAAAPSAQPSSSATAAQTPQQQQQQQGGAPGGAAVQVSVQAQQATEAAVAAVMETVGQHRGDGSDTTSAEDDLILESAKNGLRTIMKFLSPRQTVLYLNFLDDTLQKYRSGGGAR